jgi:hypothetical protein
MNRIAQLVASWTADLHLRRYSYNVRPGGLGLAWPVVLAIAVGGAVLLARRRQVAALALVALPAAVTLLVMPMPWYARLTLFVPAVGLPIAAVALSAMRPRLATLGGLGLVGLAAVSLAFANVRPNIDLGPAYPDSPTPLQYASLVLTGDAVARAGVSLRGECAGFEVIPAGARVAPGGFNLLHGVVGPDLDRVLTDPLRAATDPASLAAAMRDQRATWLVTSSGGGLDGMAASAPDLFLPFGEICQGGRLWQLRP